MEIDDMMIPKILNVYSLAKSSANAVQIPHTSGKSIVVQGSIGSKITYISQSPTVGLITISSCETKESLKGFKTRPIDAIANNDLGTKMLPENKETESSISKKVDIRAATLPLAMLRDFQPQQYASTTTAESKSLAVSIEEKEAMEIAASLFYEPNEDSVDTASTETSPELTDSFTEQDFELENNSVPVGTVKFQNPAPQPGEDEDPDKTHTKKDESDDEESILVSSSSDDEGAYEDSDDSEYKPNKDELSSEDVSDEESQQNFLNLSKKVLQSFKGTSSKTPEKPAIKCINNFLPSMSSASFFKRSNSGPSSLTPASISLPVTFQKIAPAPSPTTVRSSVEMRKITPNVALCSSTFSSNYEKINKLKLLKEEQQKAIERLKKLASTQREIGSKDYKGKINAAKSTEVDTAKLTNYANSSSAVNSGEYKKYNLRERKPVEVVATSSKISPNKPSLVTVSTQNAASGDAELSKRILILPSDGKGKGVHVPLSSFMLKPMSDGRMQLVNKFSAAPQRLIMPKKTAAGYVPLRPAVTANVTYRPTTTTVKAATKMSTPVIPSITNPMKIHANIVNGKLIFAGTPTVVVSLPTKSSLIGTATSTKAGVTTHSRIGTATVKPTGDVMVTVPNSAATPRFILSNTASKTPSLPQNSQQQTYLFKPVTTDIPKVVLQPSSKAFSTGYKITPVQPGRLPLITIANMNTTLTSTISSLRPQVLTTNQALNSSLVYLNQNYQEVSPLALARNSTVSIQRMLAGNLSGNNTINKTNAPLVISNGVMLVPYSQVHSIATTSANNKMMVKNVTHEAIVSTNVSHSLSLKFVSSPGCTQIRSYVSTPAMKPVLAVPPQNVATKNNALNAHERVLQFVENQQSQIEQKIVGNKFNAIPRKDTVLQAAVSVPSPQVMYLNIQPKKTADVTANSSIYQSVSPTPIAHLVNMTSNIHSNSLIKLPVAQTNGINTCNNVLSPHNSNMTPPVVQLAKKTQLLNMKVNGQNMVCFIPHSSQKSPITTTATKSAKSPSYTFQLKNITNIKSKSPISQANTSAPVSRTILPKLRPIVKTSNSVPIKLGVKEKLYRMSSTKREKWKFLPNLYDKRFPGLFGLEQCVSELKDEYFHFSQGAPNMDMDQFLDQILVRKKKKVTIKRVPKLRKIIEVINSDDESKGDGETSLGPCKASAAMVDAVGQCPSQVLTTCISSSAATSSTQCCSNHTVDYCDSSSNTTSTTAAANIDPGGALDSESIGMSTIIKNLCNITEGQMHQHNNSSEEIKDGEVELTGHISVQVSDDGEASNADIASLTKTSVLPSSSKSPVHKRKSDNISTWLNSVKRIKLSEYRSKKTNVDCKNDNVEENVLVDVDSPIEDTSYAAHVVKPKTVNLVPIGVEEMRSTPVEGNESSDGKSSDSISDESNSSVASLPDPNCLSPSSLNPLVVIEKLGAPVVT